MRLLLFLSLIALMYGACIVNLQPAEFPDNPLQLTSQTDILTIEPDITASQAKLSKFQTIIQSTATQNTEITKTPSPVISTTPSLSPTTLRTMATRTLLPPAKCPIDDPLREFDKKLIPLSPFSERDFVLEFLNAGGTRQAVVQGFGSKSETGDMIAMESEVTGDGVAELVLIAQGIHIFGCDQGMYKLLDSIIDVAMWPFSPQIMTIQDLNQNGIAELVIRIPAYRYGGFGIYEWDGLRFSGLVSQIDYGAEKIKDILWYERGEIWDTPEIQIDDSNKDGIYQIVVSHGANWWYESAWGPWRRTINTYTWNGSLYELNNQEYSPPEYRFQAVQDADWASSIGNYKKATELYQLAISSHELDWWSVDRYKEQEYYLNFSGNPTPTQSAPDTNEYINLIAYSRYRLMLLRVINGQMDEVLKRGNWLNYGYPFGQYNSIYSELGRAFLQEYQASQNIESACNKAIEFANDHEGEIFYYVGNNEKDDQIGLGTAYWHGGQSHIYVPEDICPFK